MPWSAWLGPPRTVRLPHAVIGYRELGQGPAVVFVHGLMVNGDLWPTNLLAHPNGDGRWHVTAVLDPNCKYADAELELAYLELFHTATPTFFKAYARRHKLPPEYHPGRAYPVLIALHHGGESGKDMVKRWRFLVNDFLRGRAVLRRAIVLVDSRHGLKPVDVDKVLTLIERHCNEGSVSPASPGA